MAKSIRLNAKKMYDKYREVLGAVSQANPQGFELDGTPHYVDMGIALLIMVHAMNNDEKLAGVPEDFDWAQFEHDYYHGVEEEVPAEE